MQGFWNALGMSLLWLESQIAGLLPQTQVCTEPQWHVRNSNDLGLPFCPGMSLNLLNAASVLQSQGGKKKQLSFFRIFQMVEMWNLWHFLPCSIK